MKITFEHVGMVIEVIKGTKATPTGIYTVSNNTSYSFNFLAVKLTRKLLESGKAVIRHDLKSSDPAEGYGKRIIEKA
jgi:hypothetical protein